MERGVGRSLKNKVVSWLRRREIYAQDKLLGIAEMARAIRPGGWAVFDIVTERCLEGDALTVWAKSGIRNGAYPAVVPCEIATRFFARHDFELKASHIMPMPPGTTELMLFQRNRPASSR
jgi:hypothetical protein